MYFSKIEQISKNKFRIANGQLPQTLTYLGDATWRLTIGVNTLENLRKKRFSSIRYESLEKLEMEHPEWKGISIIFESFCPTHSSLVVH